MQKFWKFALERTPTWWDAFLLLWLARHTQSSRSNVKPWTVNLQLAGRSLRIALRPGTTDVSSFAEVFRQDIYDPVLSPNPKVIWDIGANIGMASVYFALKYPQATIYAFEPVPENFAILKKNIDENHLTNVRAYPYGLGAFDETVRFSPHGNGQPWSYSRFNSSEQLGVEVQIRSILGVWDELGAGPIDLLKLDCEGAEVSIIKSLGDRWRQIGGVFGEMHPCFVEITESWKILENYFDLEKVDEGTVQSFLFLARRKSVKA